MSYLKNFNTIADAKSSTTLKSPTVIVVNDNGRKRVIYKRIPSARDEELLVGGNTLNDAFVSIPYNKIIYTTTNGETTITEGNKGLDWLESIGYTNIKHGNHCEMIFDDDLTEIGERAFASCSSLTSITIPNSVNSIGNNVFYGCYNLTSVTIPNSVTNIEYDAFYGCSGLASITIPESVTNIGEYAFSDCYGLTSITIPNSVTSIGNNVFSYCYGLTSITIGNSVTSIGNYAFLDCASLSSITIPNSVANIGEYAFEYCSSLTSITIPNSVENIGSYAFNGCSGFTSIKCLATTPPTLGSYNVLDNVQKVYVPAGSVNAYKSATNWSSYGDKIIGI